MKKLYIHIGPHKTGSTYIQKALHDNASLLNECNLLYPLELIGPQWGHHKLVESIRNRDEETVLDFFSSIDKDCLISSENFENLNKEDIEFFVLNTQNKFELEVIFVKRSFSDLIISNWQESVKHGSDEPWSSFVLSHILQPFSSVILNQLETVNLWKGYAKYLHILNYDHIKDEGEDLVDKLIELTHIEISESLATKNRINASLNYVDVEIIRILNSLYIKENGISPGTKIRDFYLKNKSLGLKGIDASVGIINNHLIDFSPADSWGISFFEKRFQNTHEKYKFEGKLKRKFRLPKPSLIYLPEILKHCIALYEEYKRGQG